MSVGEPRAIEVVPLDGRAGVRVRADEPVGAAVRTESGAGREHNGGGDADQQHDRGHHRPRDGSPGQQG